MSKTAPSSQTPHPVNSDVLDFMRAVLGHIILLLLLVAAERIFFDQGYFASLIQHPFWIVVLIAAVHDGLFVGVITAVAATLLMDWPPRPAEADITAHYIQIAVVPLQWLLAALCIGLFRQAELRNAKAAAVEMARLEQVNEVLALDIVKLESHFTRAQLETLSRGGTQEPDAGLLQRVLALQDADGTMLAARFQDLAEICTPLHAGILVKNTEGALKPLAGCDLLPSFQSKLPLTSEQLHTLRRTCLVVVPGMVMSEHGARDVFNVFAASSSPDRRTLHGADVL
jgi:hypothetical protein